MAYCGNCGSLLKEGAKFCSKCGHLVGQSIKSEEHEQVIIHEFREKESNTPFVLLGCILALIIAGSFYFFVIRPNNIENDYGATDYSNTIENVPSKLADKIAQKEKQNAKKTEKSYSMNKNNSSIHNNGYNVSKFTDEQDILLKLHSQTFIHNNGLKIRIDINGCMEIGGFYAGVLSVLRYNSKSALLHYGKGAMGEGKLILRIQGNNLILQDPIDGSIFYQQ